MILLQDTLVSADSSSYGLGAVLLQKTSTTVWKSVAYASRALRTTEQRYAQIEKEALATIWACERFAEFLIGKDFHIHTDHKPLVPLLGSRNLDELPPRIQCLKMRLMRFSFTISHVPGKEIATADVLSRSMCRGATTRKGDSPLHGCDCRQAFLRQKRDSKRYKFIRTRTKSCSNSSSSVQVVGQAGLK